eukprot:TRINITY_DN5749_c0_g1_i1.p1 TRINITY_DN5749_c0_g1~~TRINITY_DN5749_c0_g1_i1.p1  ORF type:complete len:819 (-),score=113.23 TRINITY_DN5749_c0_g1_i1:127-2583(-)
MMRVKAEARVADMVFSSSLRNSTVQKNGRRAAVDIKEMLRREVAKEPESSVRPRRKTESCASGAGSPTSPKDGPSDVDTKEMLRPEVAKEPESSVRQPSNRNLGGSAAGSPTSSGGGPSAMDTKEMLRKPSKNKSSASAAGSPTSSAGGPSDVDTNERLRQEVARALGGYKRQPSKNNSSASAADSPASSGGAPSVVDTKEMLRQEVAKAPEGSVRQPSENYSSAPAAGSPTISGGAPSVMDTKEVPCPEVAKEPEGSVRQPSKSNSSASTPGSPTSPRLRAATEDVVRVLNPANGKNNVFTSKKQGPLRYGPERFFHDDRTYTGVHKQGGPEILDIKVTGQVGDLSQITRPSVMREPEGAAAARQRSRSVSSASPQASSTPRESTTASEGVVSGQMRAFLTSQRQGPTRYGPERFFYDDRTYTGVHKQGGPETLDIKATGQVADLSQITRPSVMREPEGAAAARQRSRSLSLGIASSRALSSPRDSIAVSEASLSSRRAHGAFTPRRQGPTRYGPERFFYASETYTGVWKNGGPSVLDSKEEGIVSDISEILRPNLLEGPTEPIISTARERSQSLFGTASEGCQAAQNSWQRKTDADGSDSIGSLDPWRYGPERFFYETRSYTGVHKSRGRLASDFKDNSHASDTGSSAARQGSLSRSCVSTPGSRMPREHDATEGVLRSRSLSLSPKTSAGSPECQGPKRYGPERFFYDTSTYAGVHKREKHVLYSKRIKDTTHHSPRSKSGRLHSQAKMNSGTDVDVDIDAADSTAGDASEKWLNLLYGQQSETRLASPWRPVLASGDRSVDSKRAGPARRPSPP